MMKKYRIGYKSKYLTIDEIKSAVKNGQYSQHDPKIIKSISGSKILDIGCNIGIRTYEIAKYNPDSRVIGIDTAPYLVELASELYKNVSNLSYCTGDTHHLDFADEKFDCVSLLETIEHVNNPVMVIKEIHRVLKPGGHLVLSTNNVYYLRFLARQALGNFIKMKPRLMVHDETESWNRHIFCWDISTLYTLLNENGFDYKDHFYAGSSGIYFCSTRVDRIIDSIFTKILPAFRAVMVIKLQKI